MNRAPATRPGLRIFYPTTPSEIPAILAHITDQATDVDRPIPYALSSIDTPIPFAVVPQKLNNHHAVGQSSP